MAGSNSPPCAMPPGNSDSRNSIDRFLSKSPMRDRGRQSRRRVHNAARREVAQHLIAPMAIDENNPIVALPDKAVRDVIAKIDEYVFADRDGPRESHVVLVESVMDHRSSQDAPFERSAPSSVTCSTSTLSTSTGK